MNIIVVGCGRLGADLAAHLSRREHNVTVIDQVAAAFDNLPSEFRGRTVEGEVLNQDVLRRAGIDHAEGLAAVTNSDALNAVVAHVARTVYQILHVVARNYNPRWRPLHQAFDLQVVSSTTWGAQRIEELLCFPGMHAVWSADDGALELYELVVPESYQGRTLQAIMPAGTYVAVGLTRAGQTVPLSDDMPLQWGDIVYLSATSQGREALRQWMKSLPRG
jgi:trk system potassium uptake protein TrkA